MQQSRGITNEIAYKNLNGHPAEKNNELPKSRKQIKSQLEQKNH